MKFYTLWSNFIKKGHERRCFPVNIVKFLRTFIYSEEHLRATASAAAFWMNGPPKGSRKHLRWSSSQRKLTAKALHLICLQGSCTRPCYVEIKRHCLVK